ncbi:hypothetical protein MAR_022891 [Mya arenaria]|uniref:Mitochondria-eating protein C-terminal domain-containing protein n=1 Tax=Mya arenaria TaxID=6604 RepID=A0ABY7DQX7_MYAAR|nr:hypothetical protein MAR_022891 [Mya arenaria]
MLKILKDVDIICENVAKRHADAITDGLTKMVVRFKVRKARTYPTLKFDERALKLVDTHIENPACTKDVLATGKFGDPSDVNKPIKHCNNDPSTPNKKTGEQGDAQASHENLAKENKSTNQSQSENGNKDNQLKPGKMETTDSKTTDERANQKTAPTINANINHTQGENGFHEKRLEPGDNDSSTSNKTDGKQTDETDTYQNLPSKIESTSNSKVIQDNGRNEQEHTEKEAEVDSELGERKDEEVDPDTTTFNTEQKDAHYIEKVEYEERSEIIQFQFDELPTAQKQFIEDIRRGIQSDLADQVIKAICNVVLKEMGSNQADEIRNYISKCSLFCWTARSHNPPIYVDFMEVTENMRFDMSVYKPYTKAGPLVDYIVWPPIYLHKGGPMLSKGVAQGKKT